MRRRVISSPRIVTISPGAISEISTQPKVCKAQVSEAITYPPSTRRPTESGRYPHGSRTATTESTPNNTKEYAPFHEGIVRSNRSSHDFPLAAASIRAMTSVSLVAVSPKPRCKSSSRNSAALIRLPLCARASVPCIVSNKNGCAF